MGVETRSSTIGHRRHAQRNVRMARSLGSQTICSFPPIRQPSNRQHNGVRHRYSSGSRRNRWTWLARDCWGQGLNEDMKLVVLRYCFEGLGLARVAFRVDNLNTRSQRALTRLGFAYEGALRSHQFRLDGTRRDSLYFSVIASEWPETRARLAMLRDTRTRT
jgi:RimJ/RimL family protein N-acetyltransferase